MRNISEQEIAEVNGGIIKLIIAIGKVIKHARAHPKTTLGGGAAGAGAVALTDGDE